MLQCELENRPFNKAEHNRNLQPLLKGRRRGSVEFKHANISAAMIEWGKPYIAGYQPRINFQHSLRNEIRLQWEQRPVLAELAERVSRDSAPPMHTAIDLNSIFVPVPKRSKPLSVVREEPRVQYMPRQNVDYLEMDARNAALGLAGEEFVLRLEHQRLWYAGQKRLADRVEHVSRTKGDGLGYDIVSFDTNGRERLVEVKTTSFGAMTPFFASRREVAVSIERPTHFKLYRLFKFRETPAVFVLDGPLSDSCLLDPLQYRAYIR